MDDTAPPSEDFDPVWYLQANPDVAASGMDARSHYDSIGRAEGRLGQPVRALDLDHRLWRGFADQALPALQEVLAEGAPRERATAGWALARWYDDQGDPETAFTAIDVFHAHPEGREAVRHAGPFCLGVRLALDTGRAAVAADWAAQARDIFGDRADVDLMAMLCAGTDDAAAAPYLAAIHNREGLASVTLAPGSGARFDRLQAKSEPITGEMPLVSVIVPAFNAESTLATALNSLLAQDWGALEILVVDDGSRDGTATLAQEFAKRDARVKLIALPENQGSYPARNAGFAAATGEFITVLDADDWAHPAKIALQARALMEDADKQASVSHWVRADEGLGMTGWRIEHGWTYRNVSSLMLRAGLRDTLGYWDRVRANGDTEYYYRLFAAFSPAAIVEVLAGVPLSFGRTGAASLTNRAETHLRSQFHGLRRDYFDAARMWQLQAERPENLYLPQHPPVRPFRIPAALGVGDAEGPETDYDILRASDMFARDWYRLSHPDVLRADIDPVRHYLQSGARENRDPGPGFSSGGYRMAQGLEAEAVPLLHYETQGRAAGAEPCPRFEGALSHLPLPADAPTVVVFAHAAGKTLFGAERSLLDVIERMGLEGKRPVVVVPGAFGPEYLARLLEITVAVQVCPQLWRSGLGPPDAVTVQMMRGILRREGAVLAYVNTVAQEAPLLAARAEGVPSVVHVRELPAEDVALCRNLQMAPEALRAVLLGQADRFVANSEPVAHWLAAPGRVSVRPNAVEEALFDLPLRAGASLRVGLISSNIAKKGVADFLAVARRVAEAGSDMRFLLIGPPTGDLHALRPWPDNVDFKGYAATPAEALAQVDVVMSLSLFAESFGRTVVEAMAAGRPVVCYDRGAPPWLMISGSTGFVVPADDIEGAANAVLALEAATGQMPVMAAAARARARQIQDQALAPD